MTKFTYTLQAGAFLIATVLLLPLSSRAQTAAETTEFYDRLSRDLKNGKPLVTTVYVALCDNDSQGIVPVKNKAICNGDHPERNMYWKGSGGIHGFLKKQGWKKVYRETSDNTILVTEIYRKHLFPGSGLKKLGVTKPFVAYTVALAYRGRQIHMANVDYLKAVNTDNVSSLTLKDGTDIRFGGSSHIIGYIGHDYFMDVFPGSVELNELTEVHRTGDAVLAKGTLALACVSNAFVRPYITRPNVYIMALNNYLTYPSAWSIGGAINGVANGFNGAAIYKSVARYFAKGQNTGLKWARKAFSHGPK